MVNEEIYKVLTFMIFGHKLFYKLPKTLLN